MDIKKLAEKARAFNANIGLYEAEAIKKSEKLLVELNRSQLLRSKDNKDKSLKNSITGSTKLSPAYAKRTGKSTPNLWIDGTFQGEMFLDTNENNQAWFIDSFWDKTKYLVEMYSESIFGIAPSNKDKAINEASRHLIELERKNVLNS
jgi:hypothetical protein